MTAIVDEMGERSARHRLLAGLGLGFGLTVAAVGCGGPTHQVITAGDTTFTYELPVEFSEIGDGEDAAAGRAYGLPDGTLDTLSNSPVLLAASTEDGHLHSFQTLRMLGTGGEFDPLDPDLEDELPDDLMLVDYVEIGEADVWGIRMRMASRQSMFDFQALVDRRSDKLVLTEVFCTQACFFDQLDLIDEIQASWNLES